MSIITFGIFDKKLIIVAIITIINTIDLIISNETSEDYFEDILCSLLEELGPAIAGIIMNFTIKQKQIKTKKDKKRFKYLIFLFLLRLVKSSYERIYPYVVDISKYTFNPLLNTTNGIEIFLMSYGTYLLLNYKYYIHHIICMIIYCFLGIINDFILGSYFIVNYTYVYIYIIYIINEVILYCFLKYMMDKLYYHYIEVIIYWGIAGFLVKVCIFSGMIINERINDIEGIIDDISNYFAEANVFAIIFLQFIYLPSYYACYYISIILMIYYLRPNHMIITDELYVFIKLIFYKDNPNKYYTIVGFTLQIITLLFYFEILEFNFCNLNINTAKNIQIREGKDIDLRQSIRSNIELENQYYIKENDRQSTIEENVTGEKSNLKETEDNNLNQLDKK